MYGLKRLTNKAMVLASLVLILATPAQATLITFDDLSADFRVPQPGAEDYPGYDPETDDYTLPRPLTDQYEHLGVSFGTGNLFEIAREEDYNDGAAVIANSPGTVSPPNVITDTYGGDPGLTITFVGEELPDYVSFNVTGANGLGVGATARNTGGEIVARAESSGHWGPPERNTPAVPRQLLELMGEDIKTVSLGTMISARSRVMLDNLYFSPHVPVSEPSALAILLLGGLGAGLVVVRRSARSEESV